MKSGKRLVIEAVTVPLVAWVVIWLFLYIHPTSSIRRGNFNASWLITAVVSLFLALAFIALILKRRLRKSGHTDFKFKELPKVLERTNPENIKDLTSGIFRALLIWGAFSSGVLINGPGKGITLAIDFALVFITVGLLLIVSMVILFMDVPSMFYESLTGKRLSPIFKEILLISLVSGGSLVLLGFILSHSGASEIMVFHSLLKFYVNRDLYKNLLLLSALNSLYGITGILILPRRRRLGLLMLLMIALALIPLVIKIFIQLHSL
ncbi:hypothetical protein E3E38_04690 [Thermococcus sp. 18S1]|uniref:hypothetical protein n=1 Tax=Thermococcus sp. 18S1 TaxID=1638210 RepID=UPI00143936BD|nr:hypothetical protein [Thermococcus sp. 18S1]NJE30348.1 hypothetical protein [Thermococcus sp. 18S1]